MADWAASLSPAEQQRHVAYRLAADRDRFLLGRGLVRALLGRWLHIAAADVAIEFGPHGKPRCPGGPEFNVSHSGDLILLALHPTRPVGVDVEQHRPALDWPPIARRVFSSAQVEALMHRPPAEQAQAFLQGWCLLEAGLKASGLGFAGHGAASAPAQPPLKRWSVALPPGYCGALALLGAGSDAETATASGRRAAGLIRRG
ncbi:MAG: 4'-phosphopantetheinyl transferase superfamily protein [Cyanobacteria bacterium J06638_7]